METDAIQNKNKERLSLVGGKQATKREIDSENKKMLPVNWTEVMLKQAATIANKVKADAILVNMETAVDIVPFLKTEGKKFKVIVVTKKEISLKRRPDQSLTSLCSPMFI